LKERWKGCEEEGKDVSSYWMSARKLENSEIERESTRSYFYTTRFVRGNGPFSREDYLMMCLEIVTGSLNMLHT
jgi:hypothetical protein